MFVALKTHTDNIVQCRICNAVQYCAFHTQFHIFSCHELILANSADDNDGKVHLAFRTHNWNAVVSMRRHSSVLVCLVLKASFIYWHVPESYGARLSQQSIAALKQDAAIFSTQLPVVLMLSLIIGVAPGPCVVREFLFLTATVMSNITLKEK